MNVQLCMEIAYLHQLQETQSKLTSTSLNPTAQLGPTCLNWLQSTFMYKGYMTSGLRILFST